MKTRCTTGIVVVLATTLTLAIRTDAKSGPGLHSAMPAGYEIVTLKPSGASLSLMGLIECPELEGAQHIADGSKSKLIAADGSTITEFPQRFSFRITASLRKVVLDAPAATINVAEDPQDLLLKLKFRIRAYSGMESREIVPENVEMIGMPADVPYDERVYRVNINAGTMPITDRVVIDVLSPEGDRLTHFAFSLL
ncbi:MAG TPA: hypothetical protein VGK24_06740 [Candidatus Angelobacter sp.]|jgi:hypothetical protein